MINWIEATPENIKEYFFNKTTQCIDRKLCKDFCFLTDDKGVNCSNYPGFYEDVLYLNNGFLKVTHFCKTEEYEAILPKKGE